MRIDFFSYQTYQYSSSKDILKYLFMALSVLK